MRMSYRTLILFTSLALIVLCGCGILGGALPDNTAGEPAVPQATALLPSNLPTSIAPDFIPQPGLPERRRLTLEFPPQMRAGDADVVRRTLEVDDLGNLTPPAQSHGNVVTGETVEIPNLYETHHVIAEAG